MKTILAVGLGPGPRDLMSRRVVKELQSADRIYILAKKNKWYDRLIGGVTEIEKVRHYRAKSGVWGQMINDPIHDKIASEIAADIEAGKSVLYACGGDPSIYAPYAYLLKALRQHDIGGEIVPGISFFTALAMADNEALVDEEGSVFLSKYRHIGDFAAHLALNATVVYYAFGKKDAHEFRKYVNGLRASGQDDGVRSAKLIRMSNSKNGQHRVLDLLGDAPVNFEGTCVIKCGDFDRRTVVPRWVVNSRGAADLRCIAEHSGVYKRPAAGMPLTYWGRVPESDEPIPVVALFHGGGWKRGARRQFEPIAETLVGHGYACFSFDYRTAESHEASPLEAIEDARDALTWLTGAASRLNLDARRLILGGGSAGGHIAGFLALVKQEDAPSWREGVIGLVLFNPVTDTTASGYPPPDPHLAQRINLVDRMTAPYVPTVIFHGMDDETVPLENSRRFAERIVSEGGSVEVHEYPGERHTFFNWRAWEGNAAFFDVSEKLLSFLHRVRSNAPP